MSAIVKTPEGKIKLYCKGVDTVIFERLASEGQTFTEVTSNHCEVRFPPLFCLFLSFSPPLGRD
jgi:magnesium-transporting ATPase (P-type)